MAAIKIRLQDEEYAAVARRAAELGVSIESLAYGALSCSMHHIKDAPCRARVEDSMRERGRDLPLWSDSARSVAIYESKGDIHEGPGPGGAPLP